ncbi:MAG: TauD/TfdA family dioxygenase [Proteobacteria bacterium]|nr:TauD/TfdA family dioxygenase [Pseudomonadota bacterium]
MSTELLVQEPLSQARVVAGKTFPLPLGPASRPCSTDQLTAWVAAHRERFFERVMQHGAVLLRGFAIDTPDDFAAFVDSLGLDNMPYVGGAAVRNRVSGDRVLTANESPPSEPIPFHHEMSQVPAPPDYIVFYCDIPPAEGGETPIILSNEVYRFFHQNHPEFLRRVEELGVRYIRIMPAEDDPSSAIGRSWKSTYQAESRAGAEAAMREQGTSWQWLDNGNLRTVTAALPAIRSESRTGQKTFFNSMIAAYTGWVDSRNDPTKAIELGDGSPVDHDAMMAIAAYMKEHCVAFPWQKGDVLVVDNRLTMHSRNPFTPPRRILASVARQRHGDRAMAAG